MGGIVWILCSGGLHARPAALTASSLRTGALLDGSSSGHELAFNCQLPARWCHPTLVPQRSASAGYRVAAARETRCPRPRHPHELRSQCRMNPARAAGYKVQSSRLCLLPRRLMRRSYPIRILVVVATFALVVSAADAQVTPKPDTIVVDANAPSHPFPHFWEKMFGSGRAVLSLRDSYRQDLREVKQITDFEYVRFHAIFHDEVGVYDEDGQGHPLYNFSYVDQIYDGLLANHVRPFVELSFMPQKLAAHNLLHVFWYKPNVSPPKDWDKWNDLIAAFTKHLVDRYGIDEVSQWYFEVWNEPNLDFWDGEPKQSTYWELYDNTARTIKSVSQRLRVGGPATAQAAWVDAF